MARMRYKLFLDDNSLQQPEKVTKTILVNENVLYNKNIFIKNTLILLIIKIIVFSD